MDFSEFNGCIKTDTVDPKLFNFWMDFAETITTSEKSDILQIFNAPSSLTL